MTGLARRIAVFAALALLPAACGEQPAALTRAVGLAAPAGQRPVPEAMARCAECHPQQVQQYLGHGMAHSLGPLDHLPEGGLTQPKTGDRYTFETVGERVLFHHLRADGGRRTQQVVGRYGAGVADTAYIGSELDEQGLATGRLTFLPLESVTGHGLAFAPFEAIAPGVGLGQPVTSECLSCHTTADPRGLPGASRDALGGEAGRIWPDSLLGADAIARLPPLGCDACHGRTDEHAALKLASLESGVPSPSLGLVRLGQLPPRRQLDICASCHLQGEGRVFLDDVQPGGPQPDDFLARRPTVVSASPGVDHAFVSQLERLSHSKCFQDSPNLTCTSCHEPHAAPAVQGVASFEARCLNCHGDGAGCVRPTSLRVRDVTGRDARDEQGCVDCHVRRSQPFDLSHVTTADHWVRRVIPRSGTVSPREHARPDAELEVYHDERMTAALATPDGLRWEAAVTSLALMRMGRLSEALAGWQGFAAPGSSAARVGSAPPGLPPLERSADVHHLRALLLEAVGATEEAAAAYGDALRLDPGHPQARLNRGLLALEAGDLATALSDADALLSRWPAADKPWNLRALAAARTGQFAQAAGALSESLSRWPSEASVWQQLGQMLLRLDQPEAARPALLRAQALNPSLAGLAADLAATQ